MISHQQILEQIEKQLQAARRKPDEQYVRESLAAIRALCDLALDTSPRDIPQAISVPKIVESSNGKRVLEDDANGDSLFDF